MLWPSSLLNLGVRISDSNCRLATGHYLARILALYCNRFRETTKHIFIFHRRNLAPKFFQLRKFCSDWKLHRSSAERKILLSSPKVACLLSRRGVVWRHKCLGGLGFAMVVASIRAFRWFDREWRHCRPRFLNLCVRCTLLLLLLPLQSVLSNHLQKDDIFF